ncbi:MAG: TadE/TadG family type IV pilus assembly protein [Myxococcota bacterium]
MHHTRESGQAAVESALTLPLTVFMVLGTLQLFMMMQGRVMAQYAAFRATRAGSLNHGDCARMKHAAIGALLPSFVTFLGSATPGASPAQKLANAFRLRMNNRYAGAADNDHTSRPSGDNGPIVWIFRERPTVAYVRLIGGAVGEDTQFDKPMTPAEVDQRRLEVRLIYWYPMRIPFANWVMTASFLAQWGLRDYTAQNPLMETQRANWTRDSVSTPDPAIGAEMLSRFTRGQYVVPLEATYTMRMMTPAKARYFATQDCL